jgi:GH15 family glucan-1,4-alpha-glucosidase
MLPIEDYAVIGDTASAALVGSNGSVDWLCLPRFDSPACFAALLGGHEHGRWLLGPAVPARTTRRYVGDSFVLETTHETDEGVVRVVDAMPISDGRADLVRRVEGVRGRVPMRHEWVVRFGYGAVEPWLQRVKDADGVPALTAIAGPDMLVLRGDRLPVAADHLHEDEFVVSAGEVLRFSASWLDSWCQVPEQLDIDERLEATRIRWEQWARTCDSEGDFQEALVRSLLVLRLLTHGDTGGIVAAVTTSLPESFGGERNWDYRYCWLRDAALTLEALLDSGYRHEAREWRDWLLRAAAGNPGDLQIMYGVDGRRELPEMVLPHLPGYAGSQPVRIGNGAVRQRQTDVLGEVMVALEAARTAGLHEDSFSWPLQRVLVDDLATHWHHPDNGIWEVRGPQRNFTHSRVMVWAAFDRAVRAVEDHGLDPAGSLETWRACRAEVREEVLREGFDAERGTFVQHYGSREVDASLLQIPQVGFLPADDERFLGTVRAIEEDLMVDGLVLRYRTRQHVDGLPPGEHPFLACSFWLAEAYARAGRVHQAHELLERLVGLTNDVGLLSEEYDPRERRAAGNTPQALSHLALVRAVLALRAASGGRRLLA